MVGIINATGASSAWGQIKKTLETVVGTVTPPATSTTPTPAPTPTPTPAPVESVVSTPTPQSVVATPTAPEPLTYSAPSSGPRQMTATTAAPTPDATLTDRLSDAGYYAFPEAAADPVATAQISQEDKASLTQAQLIAQAAYAIVARAGADDRMSLIQDG